jgi:hypothetical protein
MHLELIRCNAADLCSWLHCLREINLGWLSCPCQLIEQYVEYAKAADGRDKPGLPSARQLIKVGAHPVSVFLVAPLFGAFPFNTLSVQ